MSEYRIQSSDNTTGSPVSGSPSRFLNSEICLLTSDIFAVLHYLGGPDPLAPPPLGLLPDVPVGDPKSTRGAWPASADASKYWRGLAPVTLAVRFCGTCRM